MSARLFREFCGEAGLECISQEIVNWVSRSRKADRHRTPGPGMPMTDAFSSFARPLGPANRPTHVYVNPFFAEEWRQCTALAPLYGEEAFAPALAPAASASLVDRAASAWSSGGVGSVLGGAKARARRAAEHVTSLARERITARQVRRAEPILNALRAGRCPDCAGTLTSGSDCSRCHVRFAFPG
jgi:hypothetical protein